jgi:quercetin dioxygenase-like cupin family protein
MTVIAPTETDALWFLDAVARVSVSAAEGDGRLSVVELTAPRGSMPPLHADPEDETFYVLDGSVTVYAGDAAVRLGPGESLLVRKGVVHTYCAETHGVRMLVVGGGAFERFLRAVGREDLRAVPPSRAAADRITAIALEHGIDMFGPPGMLPSDLA